MTLQSPDPVIDTKGLHSCVISGQNNCTVRRIAAILVPLEEPGAGPKAGKKLIRVRISGERHVAPADLVRRRLASRPTARLRDQLRAEAEPKDRQSTLARLRDQETLARQRLVHHIWMEYAAEHDQAIESVD